ncbi:MAG TPA: hypothetical protein PL045_02390 [Chitinophagaceae bacterium]|nr:hypothetical protein [Chitinophagaceae bacterium]
MCDTFKVYDTRLALLSRITERKRVRRNGRFILILQPGSIKIFFVKLFYCIRFIIYQ